MTACLKIMARDYQTLVETCQVWMFLIVNLR